MTQQNQIAEENLIATIRKDCRKQATSAAIKLTEIIQCLDRDDHRGALRAFAGLDEEMVSLKVFLSRIASRRRVEFRIATQGRKAIRKHNQPLKGEN